ncbi:MAG: GNAT family N-acetyltransferase [Clostridia bacterium]
MIKIEEMTNEYILKYAQICVEAYREEPWNECHDLFEMQKYISKFISFQPKSCYVLLDSDEIVGIALCILIPCTDKDYMRIENFCISPIKQRNGLGSVFINLISEKAKAMGAGSLLLGTVKDFPSHDFYLKNHFQEIFSSVLLYREI